jgi:hypothetical protein
MGGASGGGEEVGEDLEADFGGEGHEVCAGGGWLWRGGIREAEVEAFVFRGWRVGFDVEFWTLGADCGQGYVLLAVFISWSFGSTEGQLVHS